MSSLITGYEYDIFISYRHNDNRSGWVTEFVSALQEELAATLKDPVSVYFDTNPHDGLLETHNVDKSLEGKLKCLIFIPIISQTYCDPKSFAWQHEFTAFNNIAKEDQFGRDIRLASGNVGSRILPVKIHDLDDEDKILLENELGGVLRSIDFIYKSSGVNRPLRAYEDHPQDNLNKTYYRDQVNKVANAVKEIINAIKKHNQQDVKVTKDDVNIKTKPQKNLKTKIIITSGIILALIVLGYFVIPRPIKPSKPVEKSIAVLPFRNDTPNDSTTYFLNGVMEEILNNLQKISDFSRVLSRNSVEQFRNNTTKSTPEIAKALGVNYIVEGSGQKYGNKFILRVQLIVANNEKHLWGKSYDREIRETSDIITIQSEIAESIAAELKVTMTPEEKQLIKKIPTANLTAYDFYQRGREEHTKYWNDSNNKAALQKAEDLYNKALEYDSTFARAYTGKALVYGEKHYWKSLFSEDFLDSVLILANKALLFDNQLSEAYVFRGQYYLQNRKSEEAIKEFDKALQFNPNDWMAFEGRGDLYYLNNDYVKSIENFNKAISFHPNTELPLLLSKLSRVYNIAGFRDKAVFYIKEKIKLDKDSVSFYNYIGFVEETDGNYANALYQYQRLYALDTSNVEVLWKIGNIYVFLEKYHEALKWFKKFIGHPEYSGWVSIVGNNRIGLAFWKNGYKDQARYYFDKVVNNLTRVDELGRAVQDPFGNAYDIAGVYAFLGEKEKAYEKLRLASKSQTGNQYDATYVKNDATFESFRDDPIFQQYVRDVESKYQAEHERVRKWMEEQEKL